MKTAILMAAVLAVTAVPVLAEEASETAAASPAPASAEATVQDWLDVQRAGSQASAVPQTLAPMIQERVVKRYLDSFNAPIPVFFADEGSGGSMTATH